MTDQNTQVTVRVLDDNDNVPFFRPTSYTVTIPESTIPNSVIRTVTAFDDDIGTNAALTYSISEGNTSGKLPCIMVADILYSFSPIL